MLFALSSTWLLCLKFTQNTRIYQLNNTYCIEVTIHLTFKYEKTEVNHRRVDLVI